MSKLNEILEMAARFIERQKGKWDHSGWENFLKDIQKRGITISDETKSYVGDLLESAKKFYHSLPMVEKDIPRIDATEGETKIVASAPNPIKTGRLTKDFFMELEEGTYVVSKARGHGAYHRSMFTEEVTPLTDREAQWAKIKDRYMEGRECEVFHTAMMPEGLQ